MSSTSLKIFFGFAILVIGRLAFFTEPYGISVDESTYMAISERALTEGALYEVAVDRKPPLLFWTYQAIQLVFGVWNIHAIHFISILWILALALIAERWAGTRTAFYFVCMFSSCLPRGIFAFNAEWLMLMPLSISLFLLVRSTGLHSQKLRLSCVAGSVFLAGLSCFYKQYAGLIYAPAYIFLSLFHFRSLGFQLRSAFISSIALFSAFALMSLPFYLTKTWDDYFYWVWLDSFSYMGQDAKSLNEERSLWSVLVGIGAAWFPLFGFCVWRARSLLRRNLFLVLVTLAAAWTAFLSGRYYTHYFAPFLFFLSILGALAFDEIRLRQSRKGIKASLLILVFVPFFVFAFFNLFQDQINPNTSFNRQVQEKLFALKNPIQGLSSESNRIQVWGMASQIYVISKRGAGTSFVFADFVSGRLPGFKSAVSIPTPGAEDRFLKEIKADPPQLIIDTSGAEINDYGHFPLSRFPRVWELVNRLYTRQQHEGVDIWVYSASGLN